jgi:hypothetical protein
MLSMCATIFITSGIGLQRARRFGFRVIFVGRSLSPGLGRSLALHRAAANRGSGGASPYRRPALKGSEVLREATPVARERDPTARAEPLPVRSGPALRPFATSAELPCESGWA